MISPVLTDQKNAAAKVRGALVPWLLMQCVDDKLDGWNCNTASELINFSLPQTCEL